MARQLKTPTPDVLVDTPAGSAWISVHPAQLGTEATGIAVFSYAEVARLKGRKVPWATLLAVKRVFPGCEVVECSKLRRKRKVGWKHGAKRTLVEATADSEVRD